MEPGTPIQRVKRHFRELVNQRLTWEPVWRDVRDLVVPARGRSLDGIENVAEANSGIRHDKRINGTTSRALGVLGAGIQSGVTSKAPFRSAGAQKAPCNPKEFRRGELELLKQVILHCNDLP